MTAAEYTLDELPKDIAFTNSQLWGDKAALMDDPRIKWSGRDPVPAIGATVHVYMNHLGDGIVRGYAVSHGWLFILCDLPNPPAWWVKQMAESTRGIRKPEERKRRLAWIAGIDLEGRFHAPATTAL